MFGGLKCLTSRNLFILLSNDDSAAHFVRGRAHSVGQGLTWGIPLISFLLISELF